MVCFPNYSQVSDLNNESSNALLIEFNNNDNTDFKPWEWIDINNGYNFSNITDFYFYRSLQTHSVLLQTSDVIGWVTFAIELPAICVAAYALFRLIKAENVTPVYIINLLLSDLIQVALRPFLLTGYIPVNYASFFLIILPLVSVGAFDFGLLLALILYFAILANIGFMVCIALERYLLVVHPLWYQCRRTIKHSVLLSLAVWVIPLLVMLIQYLFQLDCRNKLSSTVTSLMLIVIALLPFPPMLFFLGATWRALSQSLLMSAAEKRRILGTLCLVLGNYTLLFIPTLIVPVYDQYEHMSQLDNDISVIAMILLYFNPLVDTLLYILVKNGPNITMKDFLCCRREQQTEVVTVETVRNP